MGETYEIYVDFYSNIPGAHLLNDIYLGLNIEKYSVNSVNITEVFKNGTESGINEGKIPESTIITKINGIQISLSNQSFKEFFTKNFSPKPGETLIFTDENENNYTLITSEKPIVPVFIGLQSQSYWIPSNWLGRLFGGLFPYEINLFIMFTLLISYSLALLNLLPISIFDGGRMIKELLHIAIGTKSIDKKAKKKLLYEYDIENSKQHLFTHSINEVIRVRELIPMDDAIINENNSANYGEIETKNGKSFKGQDLLYKTHDTSNDGFIDTVEINEDQNIEKKRFIEVEIEYEQDLKEIPKKRIYQVISSIMGVFLIASFIISIIKFGNSLFWL